MIRTLGLTLLVAAAVGAAVAAAAAGDLVPFRLQDQRGRLHTDARYRHAALVVLWGDRRGAPAMDAWTPRLAEALAGPVAGYRLRILEVAHGQGAPFFIKGKIRGKFADPGRGPVLMDWDGLFARTYACVADSCTVLLFDPAGGLLRRWTVAAPDSARLAEVTAAARRAAGPAGAAAP
ncbi:MAG: hypothetical protein ABR506_06670 [Candidatus Krumholzibacteriia bacterium]